MSDVWAQAAEGGDEQVKQELLAEADRIKQFVEQATHQKFELGSDSIPDEDIHPGVPYSRENELIDRLATALYILDGWEPLPGWVQDWYLKANAWRAAGYVDPERRQ